MDNSIYVRELVVPEVDDTWKDGMEISTTEWHFPGNGEAVQEIINNDGIKEYRKVIAKCRIVETLRLDEEATEADTRFMKHFKPVVAAEVMLPSKTPAKGTYSRTIFDGDPENPRGIEEKNVVQNLRKAWDEFIAHRGYIALGGQWLKSKYTEWREALLASEKAAKEKANVMQQKKPVGNNK
jgi:hypothetical protein